MYRLKPRPFDWARGEVAVRLWRRCCVVVNGSRHMLLRSKVIHACGRRLNKPWGLCPILLKSPLEYPHTSAMSALPSGSLIRSGCQQTVG